VNLDKITKAKGKEPLQLHSAIYFTFFFSKIHIFICLDLSNVLIASPSVLEGEIRDDDAMMVDTDG